MNQARLIGKRITRAENEYIRRHKPMSIWVASKNMFFTVKQRQGVYGATRADVFALTLEVLPIPRDRDFIDLGSGFGGITYTAGLYFRRAMGVELSPSIYDAAMAIKPELGLNKHVSFWNNDLLDVDLSKFGVIHFYEPFFDNLAVKLAERFQAVKPGTVVIPHLEPSMLAHVLPPEQYDQLLPADPARAPKVFTAFQRV